MRPLRRSAGGMSVVKAKIESRGLHLEEPLIFGRGGARGRSGVDLEDADISDSPLHKKNLLRDKAPDLPGLSEPEAVRHYVRLSQKNYGIDSGIFPLGSCTMKHNPRLNERMARLVGLGDLHPLQPLQTVSGALLLMERLSEWLLRLTGMAAVSLTPRAGAHGELCGMMAIRAALRERGEERERRRVLVPESAHGTNPATAALAGYRLEAIPANAEGRMDVKDFRARLGGARLGGDVAALMLTNPNTCGLFERDIVEIAEALHQAGGFFYCDGANFNALAGRVKPGDLGIDAMHINLHKTFSTPHGGGGPGAGPVVFSEALARFAPLPALRREGEALLLIENRADAEKRGLRPIGRMASFHGQMGMFIRALSYMMSLGGDGIRQASEDAVLSANYILASLQDLMSAPFPSPCMHEALFDDSFLKGAGVETLDFAKALIDRGVHPMTIYFPLIVRGAFLIEPTETESKESLDGFIEAMRSLAQAALDGKAEMFKDAPRHAPRRRLNETLAARKPVLRWGGREI